MYPMLSDNENWWWWVQMCHFLSGSNKGFIPCLRVLLCSLTWAGIKPMTSGMEVRCQMTIQTKWPASDLTFIHFSTMHVQLWLNFVFFFFRLGQVWIGRLSKRKNWRFKIGKHFSASFFSGIISMREKMESMVLLIMDVNFVEKKFHSIIYHPY